jgi:hypothetical protein
VIEASFAYSNAHGRQETREDKRGEIPHEGLLGRKNPRRGSVPTGQATHREGNNDQALCVSPSSRPVKPAQAAERIKGIKRSISSKILPRKPRIYLLDKPLNGSPLLAYKGV